MSQRTPGLSEALAGAASKALAEMRTIIPATVVSYDAASQTVSAQVIPCRRRSEKGVVTCVRDPVLSSLPVLFPSSANGDISMVWNLEAGDPGVLLVAERAIDEWLQTGEPTTEPVDYLRRFYLSDAIFLPGMRPFSAPLPTIALPTDGIKIRAGDVTIELDQTGSGTISLGEGATAFALLGSTFNTAFASWAAGFGLFLTQLSTAAGLPSINLAATTMQITHTTLKSALDAETYVADTTKVT